jgi:hypothetical protein
VFRSSSSARVTGINKEFDAIADEDIIQII